MDTSLLLSNEKFALFFFLLLFFAIAVTKTKQQDSFYFDPSPINQDVLEGEDVILRCDVSNRKLIMFSWTLNNKPLVNTSRRFQEDTNLRILRVDRIQDSGSFRCIATNASTGIALRSTEAKLSILWIDPNAEVQLVKPKAEEVVPGVEVTLKCQADGNPEPTVEWYRNKIRLFASDRVRFNKNRLRMADATAADNGVYSCRARSHAHVKAAESADVYVMNLAGSDGLRLQEESFTRVLLVRQNNPALFNCQFTNGVVPVWHFSNNSLIANAPGQRFVVMKNGSLSISEVRLEDAGVYYCIGNADKGPGPAFAVELLLAYLDDLTEAAFEPKPSTPQVVPINGKFDIRCQVPRGLPVPVQRWENPYGMEVTDQGRIKAADGVLSLTNVEESDGGNYTCIAENMSGSKSRSVWLVVAIPPKISRPPLSIRVTEGDSAVFDCRVIATPFPITTIDWQKDDTLLDKQSTKHVISQALGRLRIEDVQMTDEGNYACVVNTVSHPAVISSNAHLYVEKQLKFRPIPVNTKLELGSNSTIRCRAEGRVPPKIHWYKDGHSAIPNGAYDAEGALHFSGVKYADRGQYTCIASSDQGVINATIEVDIVVKPKFKVKPHNSTVPEGLSAMLHCVAIGDPLPIIQWDKNNKVNGFDLNRFKVLSNGSLQISEIYMEDVGKYGCTAGNSGGFEREEVYLHVSSGGMQSPSDGDGQSSSGDSFNMMKTVIIAVCSAIAYLAIVIGLTVYCSIRLLRAKNVRMCQIEGTAEDKGENGIVPNETTELVEKKDHLGFSTAETDARSVSNVGSHSSQSQNHPQGTLRFDKDLAFPRNQLLTLGKLGRTHYGDVFLAKAYGIREREQETLVVVKSLVSSADHHRNEFQHEVEMFRRLNHQYIVPLLGLCKETEPVFTIYEYCERGDMKQFLLHMRKDQVRPTSPLPPLNLGQMLTMCSQVASGMEYLSSSRCVHRDLAARNVLVTENVDLKIANLALCRDTYSRDYFPQHQQLIPLRWMPPEAVLEAEFSSKSDVWSFGIFMWEVFSYADQPYGNRADEDVLKGLRHGHCRLEFSTNCPNEVQNVIQKCIALNPRERPEFSEVAATVGSMVADSLL